MLITTGDSHQGIGPVEERTLIVQGMDDNDGIKNGPMSANGTILHMPAHRSPQAPSGG